LQVHVHPLQQDAGLIRRNEKKLPEERKVGEDYVPMIKIWSGFLVVKVKGKLKIPGTGEIVEISTPILIFPVNC
jgi:hypothetical protein